MPWNSHERISFAPVVPRAPTSHTQPSSQTWTVVAAILCMWLVPPFLVVRTLQPRMHTPPHAGDGTSHSEATSNGAVACTGQRRAACSLEP